MILLSQVLNGVLLPFVLIFMILLINRQDLMGEWVNPRWFNQVSWITVVVMIGLTLALVMCRVEQGNQHIDIQQADAHG
jgi:Mn2+/Fe2+ NRAMP family transporter